MNYLLNNNSNSNNLNFESITQYDKSYDYIWINYPNAKKKDYRVHFSV